MGTYSKVLLIQLFVYIVSAHLIIIIIIIIICLKSNIQTSSVDCAPRELTHACSRSDTEACDMCYVFNVNFDGFF